MTRMFPPAPDLHTDRLLLRPFVHADAPHVFAYAAQPGFFRFLDHVADRVRLHYTLADAEAHLADLAGLVARGFPSWAIVPDGEGEAGVPAGAIRFHPAPDGAPEPELGYGLGPSWWGRGYATEAGRTVVAWGLRHAPVLVARTAPANLASRRVLERLGFLREGTDGRGRLLHRLSAR